MGEATFLAPITGQQFDLMAGKGGTQEKLIARGVLKCDVSTGVPGFSYPDENGEWQGLDVDFCRAVAAVTLDNPNAVEFVPADLKAQVIALSSGEIDLIGGNVSYDDDLVRRRYLVSPAVTFLDGLALMTPRDLGVRSARELDGAVACVMNSEVDQDALRQFSDANSMTITQIVKDDWEQMFRVYQNGSCDVVVGTRQELAMERGFLAVPDDHLILPELMTEIPLGPVVRDDDNRWGSLLSYFSQTLLDAAKFNVTQADLRVGQSKTQPVLQRQPDALKSAEIDPNWNLPGDFMLRMVRAVGNFDEIFKRTFNEDPDVFLFAD